LDHVVELSHLSFQFLQVLFRQSHPLIKVSLVLIRSPEVLQLLGQPFERTTELLLGVRLDEEVELGGKGGDGEEENTEDE
jgi:hypothetical protein